MDIGIIGTGTLATALGSAWSGAGHDLRVAGRDRGKADVLADRLGGRAVPLPEVGDGADAVLLAVLWSGVEDAVRAAAPSLVGVPLVDPTNPVEHGVGVLLSETSVAEQVAGWAPGSHVVKGLHLFASDQWAEPGAAPVTVALAGDDRDALAVVSSLVRDLGAEPAVLGGLARARQLEEVAGFVIGLAFSGHDPRAAVPHVPRPG